MMLIPVAALTILASGVVSRSLKLKKIQRRLNERMALMASNVPMPELE